MSYEKITNTTPKSINFYYPFEDLFNINSLWSMYKAVHKVNEAGENLVDSYAITEDERDMFTSILSDATFDVFTRFLKYTKGVTNAILFNEDYTPSGGSLAKSVVVKIVDHEAYNANYLQAIDKVLEKCIRFYVLREWFLVKDLDSDAQKAEISYKQNLNLLLRHSMQLKKVIVSL